MNKKIVLIMQNKIFFGLAILLANFVFVYSVEASVNKYAPGDTIIIGEFVYDDDMVATTSPCTISIYDSLNNVIASGTPMTALPSGWHYYSTTTLYDEGVYPSTMTCGTAGIDLANLDRTFVIGYTSASTTAIANEVWNNSGSSSIATAVNTNTVNALNTASSSIISSINGTIENASSSLAASLPSLIWNYVGDIATMIGRIAAGVWTYTLDTGRTLTAALLGNGTSGSLAVQTDVASSTESINGIIENASSSLGASIAKVTTDVNANTNAASSSLGASIASVNSAVENASSSLAANITSAITTINANTEATVLNASTSLAATIPTAVWSTSGRTLSDFGTLVADVWDNGTRTITGGAATTSLLASDVWSYATRNLTDATLTSGSLALQSDVTSASSSLASIILAVKAKTDNIDWTDVTTIKNNVATLITEVGTGNITGIKTKTDSISWSDVTGLVTSNGQIKAKTDTLAWADVTDIKTKTDTISWSDVTGIKTKTDTIVWTDIAALASQITNASSSIVASVNENTNSQLASAITTINANTEATVLNASTSLSSLITSLPATIWAYSTKTLTSVANIASDIWNATTRTLTSSQSPWVVSTSDFGTITAGSNYLATVTTIYNGTLTDSLNIPVVTIYDPNRNVVVNNVPLTKATSSTGTYTYSYTTAGNATAGTWESVFSTTVEIDKTLPGNDYWTVVTNPARVAINNISDNIIPSIGANVTIRNEGLSGYEYHYEWCVVSNENNPCGGGDDVFHATESTWINPNTDYNTNLIADVSNTGNYYFKLIVYFGIENSGASRSFTAVAETPVTPPSGGGGGGGGIFSPVTEMNTTGSAIFDVNQAGTIKSTTVLGGSLMLSIANNTISSPTTISVMPITTSSSNYSALSTNPGFAVATNMIFEINSSNNQTKFNQPLTLTFTYSDAQITGLIENTLKVYWYDLKTGNWVVSPTTIDTASNTLIAKTDHLSKFGIFGQPKTLSGVYRSADLNLDYKVNSIDFSILLYFWKSKPPFKNKFVDINKDGKIDSVDFSILLYEWGKK